MKKTPENEAKERVAEVIRRVTTEIGGLPPYIENRGSTPFGKRGVDTHMLWHGRYFAIEVKRFDGKGKVKGAQLEVLREVEAAGGVAMVIDSEGMLTLFEAVLRGDEKPPVLAPTPQAFTPAQLAQMSQQQYDALRQMQQDELNKVLTGQMQAVMGVAAPPARALTATEVQQRIREAQALGDTAERRMRLGNLVTLTEKDWFR